METLQAMAGAVPSISDLRLALQIARSSFSSTLPQSDMAMLLRRVIQILLQPDFSGTEVHVSHSRVSPRSSAIEMSTQIQGVLIIPYRP